MKLRCPCCVPNGIQICSWAAQSLSKIPEPNRDLVTGLAQTGATFITLLTVFKGSESMDQSGMG